MPEEAAIYVLMIVLGAPAVVASLMRGDPLGTEPTLCLGLIVLGGAGLLRLLGDVIVVRASDQLKRCRKKVG